MCSRRTRAASTGWSRCGARCPASPTPRVPDPVFTPAQAQALLDETIRPLAERMVALRREMGPLERRWRQIVLAIGSNGGGLDKREAEELRAALERAHAEVSELIEEITSHGVQIKDPDRGLLDFPAVIDGQPLP